MTEAAVPGVKSGRGGCKERMLNISIDEVEPSAKTSACEDSRAVWV
jgi:hypothetical protein